MSEEQELGFKVSDRRLFNPDGSPREIESEIEAAPAPLPVAAAPAQQILPEEIFSTNTAAQRAPAPEPAPVEDEGAEGEMTEFIQFVYSVASSTTFIHLGLMEHPATGKAEVNLPAAQEGIGLLMLLREKTKGNLTRSEDEFFENLLSDLQMQFVSLRG